MTPFREKFSKFATHEELSDKPSGMIRDGLSDLRKAEQLPDVIINMRTWCYPLTDNPNICQVCLAGAVILNRVGIEDELLYADDLEGLTPGSYDDSNLNRKLDALDDFRRGNLTSAFCELGLIGDDEEWEDKFNLPQEVEITRYEDNRELFYSDMNKLADLLEKEGF